MRSFFLLCGFNIFKSFVGAAFLFLLSFSLSYSATYTLSGIQEHGDYCNSGGGGDFGFGCDFYDNGYGSFTFTGYGHHQVIEKDPNCIYSFGSSSVTATVSSDAGHSGSCSGSSSGFGSFSCIAQVPPISCDPVEGCPRACYYSSRIFCSVTVSVSGCELPLPQCSDLLPIPAEDCKGGQGLFFRANASNVDNILRGMFGTPDIIENNGSYAFWEWDSGPTASAYNIPQGDNLTIRPDGSECSNFNSGSGALGDVTICPQGWADERSSSSGENPSSGSGGDCEGSGCSASSGSGGGSSGSGGGCENLHDCDWSTLDVQLEQLGVEQEIRDELRGIRDQLGDGQDNDDYNTGRVLAGIQGLDGTIRDGALSIGDAIRGLADLIGGNGNGNGNGNGEGSGGGSSGSGDGDDGDNDCGGALGFLKSLFTNDCGGSPSGTCTGDNCYDGPADTSGLGGKANALISGGGRGFAPYTEQQISSLVPVPSGGQCPVISGNVGIGGSTRQVSFDFNNLVPGSPVNVVSFIKTVLLLIVYFINVYTMLRIFQSGGKG